jgi:tRNA(Ile)-lysidine synthase
MIQENSLPDIVLNFLIKKFPNYTQMKYLLAVSGGMDSIALVNIFKSLGLQFSIAHVNYALRGSESEKDEQFVSELAKILDVNCFIKIANINSVMAEHKISIQEAARQIRYNWFDELIKQEKYNFVVTAHHLNDNIETVIFNLIKGGSINALKGMLPLTKSNILRPLLEISKLNIEKYVV